MAEETRRREERKVAVVEKSILKFVLLVLIMKVERVEVLKMSLIKCWSLKDRGLK